MANEIAPGKWRRKLAIGPVPAWVWRCIQRGQAGISVEKGEITIRTYDEKTEAPRRLCYYDIRFEWFDIAHVWPEAETAPQPDTQKDQFLEPSSAEGKETARPKRRGAYRNEIRKYLADRKLATLLLEGKHAVADEFVEYCQDKKPELVSVLPKRREIANQVEKILGQRGAQPLPNAANNAQRRRQRPPSAGERI